MTTQKTIFENKPYSALFINGPYESRNVGIQKASIIFRVLGNLDLYTFQKILELSSNACQLSFR
jgi:hypothetical protein